MSTYNEDAMLTVKAMVKIVQAQVRGTLSAGLHLTRYPGQIVLDNTTAKDRVWVAKNFGGEVTPPDGFVVRKRGTQRYEEVKHLAPLREATDKDAMWHQRPPRIEVWRIEVPHECRHFVGYTDAAGRPYWKCKAYNCGKRITKTKARELGLLP
jgi:hypothetical protein